MKEWLSNILMESVCTAGAMVAAGFAWQAWTGSGREFVATITFVVAGFVLYEICIAPRVRTLVLAEAMNRIVDELQKARDAIKQIDVTVRR